MSWDVVVVGAGVVGLACARALVERGLSVLVVERNARPGLETSSRNSGVIHAGLYHPKGSLKTQLCLQGARLLYEWCARENVPHAAIGKFVIALPSEEARLESLYARAQENGAVEVTRVSLAELGRAEPRVRAAAALFSPRTGIVDAIALMKSLHTSADYLYRHAVTGASFAAQSWQLSLNDGASNALASWVVNAAGLEADRVAALHGFHCPQYYVKGNYYRLRGNNRFIHLIYPLPPPDHAGIGVHVTVGLDGGARLGPDVEPVDREFDYSVSESRRESFFAAASRYLDGLHPSDLVPDQAGIRPKVSGGDFVIQLGERWIDLVGIESPGLTSCLAIAERVASLLP